jgi:hypothetical protein
MLEITEAKLRRLIASVVVSSFVKRVDDDEGEDGTASVEGRVDSFFKGVSMD